LNFDRTINMEQRKYIGSTCEITLSRRLSKHVAQYKLHNKNKAGYCTSAKVLEKGDYCIVLIELFPCNSKDELYARERYWQERVDCVNKNKAGLHNSLGHIEYVKQYYHDHKAEDNARCKQYRETHKEELSKYFKNRDKDKKRESDKKYQEEHKDEIRQKKKEYYLRKKELKELNKL
jgi:putative protein kinase ArgK-like GTPase of G3E family